MKKFNKFLLALTIIAATTACDLDSEVYDQLPDENFPASDEDVKALIGANYRSLILYYDREIYLALNSSTDEWTAPTRSGGAWFDNGRWQAFAQHTWNANFEDLNQTWNWLYSGIAGINNSLNSFDRNPGKISGELQARAELRGLRAYLYYLLCDNFGKVPIKLESSPNGNIAQSSRLEVFNFIEKELKESLPNMVDGKSYSKFTKQTAHALLAKLYLNAEVYTGTARWSDVIIQCNAITGFGLSDNYFADFAVNNHNNGSDIENIFVIPYDKTQFRFGDGEGMCPNLITMHPGLKDKYGLSTSPWNGFSAIAEFYDSFEDEDVRKAGWIAGPQVDNLGNPILFNNIPLVINPNWTSLTAATDNDGARSVKFEMQVNNSYVMQDNDFPIFRYADVIMMKGEALFRLGDVSGAETEFNKVRVRAGMPTYTGTLTLDEILAERGREFYFENWRRNDLVRFDKFGNGSWRFKEVKDNHWDVYPIPNEQISKNPLLVQNDLY